jgi:hypothetical protein
MAVATNQQVQTYVDTRIRPRAEQFRALAQACAGDKIAIEDIYAHAVQPTPTWTDNRTDGPPHLLTVQDALVYNSIISIFAKVIAGTATSQEITDFAANWPVFQRACVRGV